MERSEPTLVPEWLRCSGSVNAGGSTVHHFASSSVVDVPLSTLSMRNKALRSINDNDSPRSSFLDRSSSSNSRRNSSSNGSSKHPYSSFTRSHRDKSRDKEKEIPAIRDLCNHDTADPLTSFLGSRVENTLRRSQSMVSRKPGEALPQRATELKDSCSSEQSSENGMLSGGSVMRGVQKVTFEKEFPSLGLEEKQGGSNAGRVLSPGFSTAVQSLPIGNSGLVGGEGWTSALAEVPPIIGSSITGNTSGQGSVSSPSSGFSSSTGSLNMAETLSQAPSCARTTPQLPDKIQRLEELAIKQSRQLIPMRPSTPKPLVLNSSDRLKQQPKTTVRAHETIGAAKSAQQQSLQSHSASHSPRFGQIKSDTPKMAHVGKFLVLKPVRESGVGSTTKDDSCTARGATSQVPVAPAAPLSTPSHTNHTIIERKAATYNPKSLAEKRASLLQAQSRNDFFNLMRKKNSLNSSTIAPNRIPAIKTSEVINEASNNPDLCCVTGNGNKIISNGDGHTINGHGFTNDVERTSCLNEAVYPDEEEAAFLRSLGWEENDGEDEGLTEEEINAFYQEYMKLMPSLKAGRGLQPKASMLSESYGSK